MSHSLRFAGAALVTALSVASCKPAEPQVLPPPLVTVTQSTSRPVTGEQIFIGSTRGARTAEVRARVRGFLRSIEFEVGTPVEEGQVLFTIEPQEFEAQVRQAEASLAGAEAEFQRAQADFERLDTLLKQGSNRAVSESQVDLARAERDKADANIAAAKAALAEAKLNLSYTEVVSPIAGRVGRNLVDVGNLVGASDATLLTTVVELDPLHVYFDISERIFTDFLREFSAAPVDDQEERNRHPVFIALEGDEGFPHPGWIDFMDNTAQADTGTIRARAVVPNEDLKMYPGLFARILVPARDSNESVLVQERAIGTDLGGKYVLVLGEGGLVERRSVAIGKLEGAERVILEGLQAGETYIVDGMVRARPGMPVRTQTLDQASAPKRAPEPAPAKPGEGDSNEQQG